MNTTVNELDLLTDTPLPPIPDMNPYGIAYLELYKTLAREKRHAQMMFALYVSCRSQEWEFNTIDIAERTGIERHCVNKLCRQMVEAGIFRPYKTYTTLGRSMQSYVIDDMALLQRYLQGNQSIENFIKQPDHYEL